MIGVIFKDLIHGEEHGLVFTDDAGVWRNLGLAFREGIESVDSLVRGDIGRKMDDNLHFVRGHIVNLLDVDLLLLLGLYDAVYDALGGFSIGDFSYGDGALVHLVDAGAYLYHTSALALVVLGAVCDAAGREVRENLIRLTLQDGYGGVNQFVEIVGQDLGTETGSDAFRALGQQQREAHGKFRGLLVAAVIGSHPGGYLGVEYNFLRKL